MKNDIKEMIAGKTANTKKKRKQKDDFVFDTQYEILEKIRVPALITSVDLSYVKSNSFFSKLFKKEPAEINGNFIKSIVFLNSNKTQIPIKGLPIFNLTKRNPYCSGIKTIIQFQNKTEKHYLLNSFLITEKIKDKNVVISFFTESIKETEINYGLEDNINSLSAVLYTMNSGGDEYQFIAETVRTIYGYSPAEVCESKTLLLSHIYPEDLVLYRNFITQIINGKEAIVEYRVRDRFGKEHWLRHYGTPLFKDGEIEKVVGLMLDITEDKVRVLKLENSEERFRMLIDTADDLIFILDGFGYFNLVNKNGANALGYSLNEILGKHFLDFIDKNDEQKVIQAFSKILSSEGITVFEAAFLDRFDKSVLFEIHAKPVLTDGQVGGMLSIGRNISIRKHDEHKIKELNAKLIEASRIISIERERARNKITVLEELNKLKSEFISNVSHELRTPLASIVGFAETISTDPDIPKEMLKDFSNIILTEGKRLAKLINDLLDFSKLESGEEELNKEEVDIIHLIDFVSEEFNDAIKLKNLILTKDYPNNQDILIELDIERFKKVFNTLIANSIKFTGSGGRISILVQDFGKEIEIAISDTGIGIPEKDLPNLFQKFSKIQRQGAQISGSGFGLVGAKQIIDLHKGFIKVRSEEDKGTTFIIRIPKKEAVEINVEKLVFIVDDEESILKMISHWVKGQWGYTVKAFSNGSDALNSLSDDPDLVLLDIMLPDINGNEVLSKIKQRIPNLPVIMLSAQGSVEVALDSVRLGAFDYFPKPIDKNRLEPAIRNAIKNYDLERELFSMKENIQREYSFDNIISSDKKMQEALKMISKVLDNDITVLIQGESGTGKELVARAIHYNGKRKNAPFVVVNCASIPRELLESELFGHEKGSFTGAYQRKIGKFELAKSGTLFLDEIGEMEMSLQAKILRVIQQKEFERIGGNEILKSDVRILSATNRDLKIAVEQKQFREDLFYRLASFPILIPPLRERRGDIVVLIDYFLKIFNEKLNKSIKNVTKPALKLLYDYDWPGNIRELENTLERCLILTEKDVIDIDILPQNIVGQTATINFSSAGAIFGDDSPIIPFEKLKEEAIRHALRITVGNIVEAARKLRIGRATLYRLMDKYKIEASKN